MFERFKNKKQEQRPVEDTAPAVGITAISGAIEQEVSESTVEADREAVKNSFPRLASIHEAFNAEALAKGMNEQQIADAAKYAINERLLPRVVPGLSGRDGRSFMIILHGDTIPDDVVDVYFDNDSNEKPSDIKIRQSLVASLPAEPAPDDPNGFYTEVITISSSNSPEEWHHAAERLNASLDPYTPPAAPTTQFVQ